MTPSASSARVANRRKGMEISSRNAPSGERASAGAFLRAHDLDQRLDGADGRLRQDAVPEVHDVPAPAAGGEHLGGARADRIGAREEHGGVEVALERLLAAGAAAR